MVVILKIHVLAGAFALGRALPVPEGARVELETLVDRGERSQPYLWVMAPDIDAALSAVRERASADVTTVEVIEDRALVALDWDANRGDLFSGIGRCGGQILTGRGDHEGWEFDVRFPEHADLSRLRRFCEEHGIEFTVGGIYAATVPETDPSFGMTERQRETLECAVQLGYYDIPRRCRTSDLARHFVISDQAVMERLRRGIANLVSATLSPESETEVPTGLPPTGRSVDRDRRS
jgi:predicted DNA binding protein